MSLAETRSIDNITSLSVRQWFAGQALAGILANPTETVTLDSPEQIARGCYAVADAMVAESAGDQRVSIVAAFAVGWLERDIDTAAESSKQELVDSLRGLRDELKRRV